jgi:MFS family permease
MKFKNLLFIISFIEGGALMAAELISSKLMGAYYGSSLIVWTSVFVCTLGGLALGYYLGGIVSAKENLLKNLIKILLFSALFFAIMSPLSNLIMEITLGFSIELGSLISVLVFLFPLLIAFGMVSPILIKLISESSKEAGQSAGNIYTISTFGGILTSLLVGFYAIPFWGLKLCIIISSIALFVATFLAYLITKRN